MCLFKLNFLLSNVGRSAILHYIIDARNVNVNVCPQIVISFGVIVLESLPIDRESERERDSTLVAVVQRFSFQISSTAFMEGGISAVGNATILYIPYFH